MYTLQLPRTLPRVYLGDTWLLIMAAILVTFGLIMMTSASIEISSQQYGDAFFHFKRQLIFIFMGLASAAAVIACPMRHWYKGSVALLAVAYLMLLLVLIPGIGREVNGSSRWFRLGFMSLQASEPAKLFVIVFVAWFLGRHREMVRS